MSREPSVSSGGPLQFPPRPVIRHVFSVCMAMVVQVVETVGCGGSLPVSRNSKDRFFEEFKNTFQFPDVWLHVDFTMTGDSMLTCEKPRNRILAHVHICDLAQVAGFHVEWQASGLRGHFFYLFSLEETRVGMVRAITSQNHLGFICMSYPLRYPAFQPHPEHIHQSTVDLAASPHTTDGCCDGRLSATLSK